MFDSELFNADDNVISKRYTVFRIGVGVIPPYGEHNVLRAWNVSTYVVDPDPEDRFACFTASVQSDL